MQELGLQLSIHNETILGDCTAAQSLPKEDFKSIKAVDRNQYSGNAWQIKNKIQEN